MAKMESALPGGMRGTIGGMISYQWNGKWVVRSRPGRVRNPRTEEQQASRASFAAQVRLAAQMAGAVRSAMRGAAREAGMTAYNYFQHVNQRCFAQRDGRLEVDWPRLMVSDGAARNVEFRGLDLSDEGVLTVRYHQAPGVAGCDSYDQVVVYVHAPALGRGICLQPGYRYGHKVRSLLPQWMRGTELMVYGYVRDDNFDFSPTAFVGRIDPEGEAEVEPAADGAARAESGLQEGGLQAEVPLTQTQPQTQSVGAPPAAFVTDTPPGA